MLKGSTLLGTIITVIEYNEFISATYHFMFCSAILFNYEMFLYAITVNYIELFDMQTEDIKSYNGKLVR